MKSSIQCAASTATIIMIIIIFLVYIVMELNCGFFVLMEQKKRKFHDIVCVFFYVVKLYYFFCPDNSIWWNLYIQQYININMYIYVIWPMNRLHKSVVYFHLLPTFIFQFNIYDELKLIVWIEYWNNYNCIFGERFMAFIVFHVPHSLTHNQLVGKLMEALWWLQKMTWCQHFQFFFVIFYIIPALVLEWNSLNLISSVFLLFFVHIFLKHHYFPFNFWFFSPTGEYKNYTIIKWFNSFLFSTHTHIN